MEETTYFTLKIEGVPEDQEDLIVGLLFDLGASGVQEDLNFSQKDRSYLPEVVPNPIKNLVVYFEKAPQVGVIENLKSQFSDLKFSWDQHQSQDWLQNWKDQWEPFELISDIWIVPDWHKESFLPESGKCIYIEPGMAFGTGTHATTQLASRLIKSLNEKQQIQSLLDVGTGSGILSLLASHLEIPKIYANDNDPESKRVFNENLEKNPNGAVSWVEDWAQTLPGQVDVTLANIIDGVLLDLKPQFQQMKSPYYIFTGILAERESTFLQEMTEGWNLETLERLENDEWVGFLMKDSL